MTQRLLEGRVEVDQTDNLKREILRLEAELSASQQEVKMLTERAHAKEYGLVKVRETLSPLFQGLKMFFGELDDLGIEQSDYSSAPSKQPPKNAEVWESWKQRLGGSVAKIIDALLVHGELNTQQLAIATGLHRTTIPKQIYLMNKAGLLHKNGGRFSLKQL